jgi:sugar lactone lactonase YvrE
MAGSIGLVAALVLSCTAANPAYHAEDRGPDAGGEPSDGGASSSLIGPDATSEAGLPMSCGSAQPPLGALVAVDSLAIDGRGNIYFSNDDGTNAWIGRLPPRGGSADKHWLPLAKGLPTRGMAVDDARGVLYFTTGSAGPELQAADLAGAPPSARTVFKGLIDPNDLAMGFDGNVYVSDQGDGQIYSVTAAGKRTKVTSMPIGVRSMSSGPAGLTFAPDRTLVVGYKGGGQLIRISLTDGLESRRVTFGPVMDWVNGLAYDQRGRLYLSLFDFDVLSDVVRLDSDTATPVPVASGGRFSAMAMGRGELDCRDLYVADPSPGQPVRRIPTE